MSLEPKPKRAPSRASAPTTQNNPAVNQAGFSDDEDDYVPAPPTAAPTSIPTQNLAAQNNASSDEGDDDFDYEDDGEDDGQQETQEEMQAREKSVMDLMVPLSASLLKKIKQTAEEEGISIHQLAIELISEGLVLRVWDILERNQNIRGQVQGQGQGQSQGQGGHNPNHRPQNNNGYQQRNFNNQNNNNNRGGGHNNNSRNNRNVRNHANNMNLMQDKAAFLEYVRNQERKRR